MGRRDDDPACTPANVLKIMISTDNHLGYLEKDPIRGDDSFRTFEEFLTLAQINGADLVLLGGDLFHDNKPSRRTTLRTMSILRRFCLGPKPVSVVVRSKHPPVNYMDPCCAVQLPVFAIHGNHDDPTGSAGTDALSAIDILAMSNLVTYFGKAHQSQRITITPVLLQKGITKLALFGLGNIRDERLYNTWHTEKKVHWQRPALGSSSEDNDPWFNLFVLHQNRAVRGTAKAVSESMLPDWLDLVLWGHEHESIREECTTTPAVIQPGSTVATSLSEGESRQKHCALIEVYRGKKKLRWIPLQTTRIFIFDTISLSNIQKGQEKRGLVAAGDDEDEDQGEIIINPGDEISVTKYLMRRVEQMVAMGESRFRSKRASWSSDGVEPERGTKYPAREYYTKVLEDKLRMPLIRLRVEYSGAYEPISLGRFGQDFVGKVACPSDILLFFRKKAVRKRRFLSGQLDGSAAIPRLGNSHSFNFREEEEEDDLNDEGERDDRSDSRKVSVSRLVHFYLYSGGKDKVKGIQGLKFLELDSLSNAVEKFVEKSENKAIPEYVDQYLEEQQKETIKQQKAEGKLLTEDQIRENCEKNACTAAARVFGGIGKRDSEKVIQGEGGENDFVVEKVKQESMELDADGNADGREKQLPGIEQIRKSMAAAASDSLSQIEEVISKVPSLALRSSSALEEEDEYDDGVEEEEVLPKSTRGPRAPAKHKAPPVQREATATRKRKRAEVHDDEEEEEDEEYQPFAKQRKAPARRRMAPRKSRVRARGGQTTSISQSSFMKRRARQAKFSPAIILDSDDEGDNAM